MDIDQNIDLFTIIKLHLAEKSLDVIESSYHDIGFAKYVNVNDTLNSPFSVLIFQINDESKEINSNQFLQIWRQTNLNQLEQKAEDLKSFNHENIAKCYDSFLMEDYFYVRIERIQSTLFQWINQHQRFQRYPLSKSSFIKIALQILRSVEYLHEQKCILHRERILENFMIDSKNQIKLFHFDFPEKVEVSIYQKIFLYQLENSEQFYYHPRSLDIQGVKYAYNYNRTDIWSLAICFLQLTGVSYMNILESIQKKSIFLLALDIFDYGLTSIIIHMLKQSGPGLIPSVSCLIQQFENVDQDIIITPYEDNFNGQEECKTKEKQEEEQQQQNLVSADKLKRYAKNLVQAIGLYGLNTELNLRLSEKLFLQCLIDFSKDDYAYLYLALIDKQKSLKYLNQAIQINKKNSNAIFHKGLLEYSTEEKIEYYESAIQIDINNDVLQHNLGEFYWKQGDLNKAIFYFENVLSINECSYQTLCQLGDIEFDKGRYKESEQYYLRSLEINPNYYLTNFGLGLLYKKTLELDKAIEFFKKCLLNNHPEKNFTYLQLAIIYKERDEIQKAIDTLKEAIQLKVESWSIYSHLASFQESLSLYSDAISNYKIAINLKPIEGVNYHNLGMIYLDTNRNLQAIPWLKTALKLNDDGDVTRINLLNTYLRLQQFEKVILLCNKSNNQDALTEQHKQSKIMI